MVKEWLTRLRFLVTRKTHDDVDEELAFHLEQQTTANIASGMSSKEARRQALIAFGGVELAREECREERPGFWMETLAQDVRYSVRGFRRNPVFTLTIVSTLMLGIGATTAVFSVVDRILFRSLPYAHADRLVSLGMVQSLEMQEFAVGYFYYDWRENQRPFEAFTSENAVTSECDLTERNPAQLQCPLVEASFLPTLGISPVLGRNFLPEEDRPHGPKVALISYGLWRTRYNRDPGVLNRNIEIDGSAVRIVGVLPENFEMPRLQEADVLLPMARDELADRKSMPGGPRRVFARLKPGVSVEQARAEMEPLFQDAWKLIPADIRKDFHLQVRSLRDRQMQDVRVMAWVLLGAVAAVLLIACANVASLLMARGAVRQREMAVRSALGASRARLVRQALTEAALLSLAGAVAGCVLAEGLLRIFIAIAPAGIPFIGKAQLDLRIIGFTVMVSLACGALFGLIPALQRPNAEMLSGRALKVTSHALVRQWLVVGQIAASMVLLAGAMLLVQSFRNLENQQMGMRVDNTLTASITLGWHSYPTAEGMMAFYEQLVKKLRYGPGVSMVAVCDSLPPAANHNGRRFDSIIVSGEPRSVTGGGLVTFRWVSPEYFHALDIPIIQGEGFTEDEVNLGGRFVVLSQELAARLFPGKNAIGQRILLDGPETHGAVTARHDPASTEEWLTVVGVAANVKNAGLSGGQLPEYYKLRRQRVEDWGDSGTWGRTAVIVVRTSLPPEATARWIRSQVAALDPTLPVEIATLKERVSKLADQPRFQTVLIGFFAASGLMLAVIGLYGVMAFLVTQRAQEIGVRMALGADRRDILRLVMGKSVRLILAGTALGLLASLAASQVLSSLLFGVGARDPITFGWVTLLLVVVALVATAIPARSATKVDPMVALRCD
jgi:putative ABC transport system permease protein